MRRWHALGHGDMALPDALPMPASHRRFARRLSRDHPLNVHLRLRTRRQPLRTPRRIGQTQHAGDAQDHASTQPSRGEMHVCILAFEPAPHRACGQGEARSH